MQRRQFLTTTTAAASTALAGPLFAGNGRAEVPPHLAHFATALHRRPIDAALAWFGQAEFGLFMHHGLYSILGRHEWVMFREKIPVKDYEKLTGRFDPEKFDTDFITDLVARAWAANKDKHNEICDTQQPQGRGYMKADEARHKTPDQVMGMLKKARSMNCKLLLNTGPLPDGAIHPDDIATLREGGKRRD
ncbi:alpha-L-fucosidase [Haloferula sp. A504]|uniref:alpha-L-fucosidase n=1 Tax=Haloferula sp. A504 TaxID=3373601 RepID=UPI0031BDDAC7|nr:alpha-L-fucosidase [Verrucomicrobiaceae bacterium E54]